MAKGCVVPSDSANYLTLLRTSGAAAFFLPAAVGRLGIATTGIGIVWILEEKCIRSPVASSTRLSLTRAR